MMNKNNLFHALIFVMALKVFSGHLTQAEELVFEPVKPVVAVGESISLSVSASIKNIFWQLASEDSGKIQGAINSSRVTYVAPNQVGQYWITVIGQDDADQLKSGLLGITVLSKQDCEKHPACGQNDEQKQKAAIMIHAAGESSRGEIQETTLNFLAHYVYQSLKTTLFKDEDIYYLAPNGNRQSIETELSSTESENSTIPAYLTLDNIEAAFNWAKTQEIEEQPLIVIFIASGLPDKLILGPSNYLFPQQLKALLDNYQSVTGNQVVVILEASYSGTLIKHLKGNGRIIISSTDEQLAYYSNLGQNAFTHLYFEQLQKGKNYSEALQLTKALFSALPAPLNQQQPQLEDSAKGQLAQKRCLNKCWENLPGKVLRLPVLENILPTHQPIDLSVEIDDASLVSVIITHLESRLNEGPTILELREKTLDSGLWRTRYNGFTRKGTYLLNFSALTDDHRELPCLIPISNEERCFLTIKVEQNDAVIHARLNGNLLDIPALAIPDNKGGEVFFQVRFIQHPDSRFELEFDSLVQVTDISSLSVAHYNPNTFSIQIPLLDTSDAMAQQASLQWIPLPGPALFELTIESMSDEMTENLK
jgi:hypothetical protein